MPYVCPECGEEDSFYADANCGRSYRASGYVRVDGEGDWEDFDERDSDNYDIENLEFNNVRCSNCDASARWCEENEVEEILNNGCFRPTIIVEEHIYSAGEETTLCY